MSLDSMAIATDGYVSRTIKKALIIAVAGYLNFGGGPTPPPIPPDTGGGGGGISHHAGKKEKEIRDGRRKKILKDDDEFWAIVKMWTEANNS